MSVEYVDIDSIKPGERPFTVLDPADGLVADIKRHGIQRPLLVDGSIIVDGVRRWNAARELGIKEVPVLVDATFLEAVALVQPARSDEDFRVSYLTRWFDLVPLLDYLIVLGKKHAKKVRGRGYVNGRPQFYGWGKALYDEALDLHMDAVRKLRVCLVEVQKHIHEPVVQQGLEQMRQGTLGPAGMVSRMAKHFGRGNIRLAEDQVRAYRAMITNLEANERLIKNLGPTEGEIPEDVRASIVTELNRLISDHRRLVNRVRGHVQVRVRALPTEEEPTA